MDKPTCTYTLIDKTMFMEVIRRENPFPLAKLAHEKIEVIKALKISRSGDTFLHNSPFVLAIAGYRGQLVLQVSARDHGISTRRRRHQVLGHVTNVREGENQVLVSSRLLYCPRLCHIRLSVRKNQRGSLFLKHGLGRRTAHDRRSCGGGQGHWNKGSRVIQDHRDQGTVVLLHHCCCTAVYRC